MPKPAKEHGFQQYWAKRIVEQYSSDPVVKFGFCRGLEPVNYVSHILERFEHYKQFVVA
jgi:membrane-bound lytic murein transglycosylase F